MSRGADWDSHGDELSLTDQSSDPGDGRSPRRIEDARVLASIAITAAVEDDVRRILVASLDRLPRLIRFTGASVALVEGDELAICAAVGPFAGSALTLRLPRGRGRAWQVVERGESVRIADLLAEGSGSMGGDPLRSWLAVPLIWRGRCLGLLEVDSTEPGAFAESDQILLEGVAAVLSGSIELAERYAAEVRLHRDLAAAVEAERRARADAEQALHTRDQFFSIASHELKTPLTPIKAGAQLLMRAIQQPEIDRARVAKQLRTIDTQVDRLRMLVDDLLDTARIQSGHLELRFEPVDLVDVVARVVSSWEEVARARITFEATESLAGQWDPTRIEQVVTNLIDNALKYSPPNERVDVLVRRDGPDAAVSVRDRGIGIPGEARARIFEPFSRGSNVSNRTYGGLGLGLFISQQIVEQHGGRIKVDSEVGGGTTFHVYLPLEA